MNMQKIIKEKWEAWKAKTFTKENIKRFLLVQVIDLSFVTCLVLSLAGVIPFAIFVAFAIFYVATVIIKRTLHAAETIRTMSKTCKSKEKK